MSYPQQIRYAQRPPELNNRSSSDHRTHDRTRCRIVGDWFHNDHITNAYAKCVRNDLKCFECHALATVLQPIEVHAVQSGKLRELILGDSLLEPDLPNSLPDRRLLARG